MNKERLSKHYRKSILSESQRNQMKVKAREARSRHSSLSSSFHTSGSRNASLLLNQKSSNDKKVDRTVEHVFTYPRQETLIESRNRLLSNHTLEESSKPHDSNLIASAD